MSRRILFTGGGSAGHVTPNLALMAALQAEGWDVHYAGSRDGIERELAERAGAAYHALPTGKLRRYLSMQNLLDLFRVLHGIVAGWRLCRRLRPALVFSKGGFVSVPVVFGARLAGVPVLAHESDLTPGLATRLVASSVRMVCTNFPETRVPRARAVRFTGTPIRAGLLTGDAEAGLEFAELDDSLPVLLVVGGSLGSMFLNGLLRASLDALLARFQVIHICGRGHLEPRSARPGYAQFEFVAGEFANLLAAADLVVSRAGANAVLELIGARKPALLVPLGTAASRGDQLENARWAEGHGLAHCLPEAGLDEVGLQTALVRLEEDRARLHVALAQFELPDAESELLGLIRLHALPAATAKSRA